MDDNTTTTGLETGIVARDSKDAQGRFVKGFTKAVDVANRTIDGVASTINLDRHGEVILPSAVGARADDFLKSNAPFLAAHSHRAGDAGPTQIGWVTDLKVDAGKVACQFRFGVTGVAEEWWKLASDSGGKGIAFSIGFYPIRWVFGSVADLVKEFPELKKVFRRAGLADTDRVRVYTEIELVEISAVPCPANRESVQVLMAKFFDTEHAEGAERSENGDEDAVAFIGAMAAAVAGKIEDTLDEKIGCLESLRFDVEESLEEIKMLLAGDSPSAAASQRPDCDGGDDETRAGTGDQGESEVAAACESLLAASET